MPVAPLRDLLAWWKESKVRGAIIGGLAVSLISKPRLTRDVDAVVALDDAVWKAFLKVGRTHGFRSRIPGPLLFAQESRMFVLSHIDSGIEVDVSIAGIPFEVGVVERAERVKVGRLSVPVATAEDLIVYKAIAGRPQDQNDIAQLLRHLPNLDLEYVRCEVGRFAAMLGLAEIAEDLERILLQGREE